jgi:hypothetical protein
MPKRKKTSIRERLWEKTSSALLNFAESIPPVKRGLLNWLQTARYEPRLTQNAPAQGIELELESIWICEIIPIEHFDGQIRSILRLLEDHKTTRFIPTGRLQKDVYSELKAFKNSVLRESWHNIGLLDFEKIPNVNIDTIGLQIRLFSGGHVALFFEISPNEKFRKKLSAVIHRDYSSHTVLFPPKNIRSFFRGYWGSRTTPGETKKIESLQKLIVDLKDETKRYLSRHISHSLIRKNYVQPSIELWIKEDKSLKTASEKPPFQTFWESIELREDGPNTYKESSGTYHAILPHKDIGDLSIKLVCDKSKIQKAAGFTSIKSQIVHDVSHWIPPLLSLWWLKAYYLDLISECSQDRTKLFSRLQRLRARATFRWARSLSSTDLSFKRIRKDFDLANLDRDLQLFSGFPDFKRNPFPNQFFLMRDEVIGNLKYLVQSSGELLSSTQQLLKTRMESLVASTNYWTQIAVVLLSVVMGLTSLLAVTTDKKLCDAPHFKSVCEEIGGFLMKR